MLFMLVPPADTAGIARRTGRHAGREAASHRRAESRPMPIALVHSAATASGEVPALSWRTRAAQTSGELSQAFIVASDKGVAPRVAKRGSGPADWG